jgi:dienelactone hydrolase
MFTRVLLVLFVGVLAGLPAHGGDRPGTGPWNVRELQKTPRFELGTPQESAEKGPDGEVKVLLTPLHYAGEPWMGNSTRVFAYYARPRDLPAAKLPAMVLVHGGGGKAFPEWARLWAARGYAALAMDLAGQGADGNRLPDGGPGQGHDWKFEKMKEGLKNTWPYQAVASVIRGVSVLRAQPEVDRNRIGITGISWGGYLTSLVMSLDDRLKAAVPVYGCGFLHENSAWLSNFQQLPEDERRSWIENFDPSRYLARCKIPTLWVNGTNDFAYPLDSYQKSYRAVRGPRALCVTVKMPHSHQAGWAPQEIHLFTDALFRGKEFAQGLPVIAPPARDGEKLKLFYSASSAVQKVQIHWTVDLAKPWQQREWQSASGQLIGLDDAEVTLPKERPCVFFVTLTDVRGAVASTEHAELR